MNARGMRRFADQMARAGEALKPAVVTIGGQDIECELRDLPVDGELEEGGEVEEGELTVFIRKAVLPEKPADEQPLIHRERSWWIKSVEGDEEMDAVWTLICEIKN